MSPLLEQVACALLTTHKRGSIGRIELRCPNFGHVMYLDIGEGVRGPTCVFQDGGLLAAKGKGEGGSDGDGDGGGGGGGDDDGDGDGDAVVAKEGSGVAEQ